MNIIIFILLFIAVAFIAVMTAGMQIQINKLTAITETHSGRIAENRARTENNDARIKKFSNATHTEVQKMWADTDSTILKLEEITRDIKRLDELETKVNVLNQKEEDTRENLLKTAEQVKKNQHNISEISSYYCNYVSRKDKDDEQKVE